MGGSDFHILLTLYGRREINYITPIHCGETSRCRSLVKRPSVRRCVRALKRGQGEEPGFHDFMMTRAELQRLDLNMLAMYCQRVSESYPENSAEADQARGLKREWAQLIGYVKPPIPGIDNPEDRAHFTKELIERMIDLLAKCNLPANWRGSVLLSVKGGNGTPKSKKSTA